MDIKPKFYIDHPPEFKDGEIPIVQVIFTHREDTYFHGELVHYEGNVILQFSDATKKRKIRSIIKLVQMNVPVFALLEDFDSTEKKGRVMINGLSDIDESYQDLFFSNNKLYDSIYHTCKQFEIDFKHFWETKFFNYLIQGIGISSKNNYLSYVRDDINNNFEKLRKITDNEEFLNFLVNKLKQIDERSLITKKLAAISNNSILEVKKLFEITLEEYDDVNVKYSLANSKIKNEFYNYVVSSNNEEKLNSFLEKLKLNKKKFNEINIKY